MFKQLKGVLMLMALAGLFLLAKPVWAADVLNIQMEKEPLFSEANLTPGSIVTRWISVGNVTDVVQRANLQAVNIVDSQNLGAQMFLTARRGQAVVWQGTWEEFFLAGEVDLGEVGPGETIRYDLSAGLEPAAGNKAQAKNLSFDLVIGVTSLPPDSGGGGGGSSPAAPVIAPVELVLSNEVLGAGEGENGQVIGGIEGQSNYAVVKWTTNKPATSRVVWGRYSLRNEDLTNDYTLGYEQTTEFDPEKVIGHSVVIAGLEPDTVYYFRPLSSASPEKYGKEISYRTVPSKADRGQSVLGVKLEKKLAVSLGANRDQVNVGGRLQYQIKVTNVNSEMIKGARLTLTLPNGFLFSDNQQTQQSWILDAIAPGQQVTRDVYADVNLYVDPGPYAATAAVQVVDADLASAQTTVTVVKGQILGVKLAATGFKIFELWLLTGVAALLLLAAGIAAIIKRRLCWK